MTLSEANEVNVGDQLFFHDDARVLRLFIVTRIEQRGAGPMFWGAPGGPVSWTRCELPPR